LVSWSFNISNRDEGYGYNNDFLIGLASSAADARVFTSTAYYFVGGGYVGNRMMLARHGGYAETPIIDITNGLPPLPSKGSFRITYDPSTHIWSLYGEIGTSYVNPATVTNLLGSVTDSTHTSEDLPYIYIGGSTPGTIFFDNLTVSVVPSCWDNVNECAGQPLGDATCDGIVNLGDLVALKAAWGQSTPWTPPFCCADFDQSGAVNLEDLITLKAGWGISGYSPSTLNQNCP
jgi:hypothetical protein